MKIIDQNVNYTFSSDTVSLTKINHPYDEINIKCT